MLFRGRSDHSTLGWHWQELSRVVSGNKSNASPETKLAFLEHHLKEIDDRRGFVTDTDRLPLKLETLRLIAKIGAAGHPESYAFAIKELNRLSQTELDSSSVRRMISEVEQSRMYWQEKRAPERR